jgi:hypothetical protein
MDRREVSSGAMEASGPAAWPTTRVGRRPWWAVLSRALAGPAAVAGLLVLVTGLAWIMIAAPAFVVFGLAVAAAVAWCIWLERHPGPDAGKDDSPR